MKKSGVIPAACAAGLFLGSAGIREYLLYKTGFIPGLAFLLSVIAFVTYAADKRAAVRGSWRVPEANLHLLALIGGWPGALIAQQTFRHKTRKLSFRVVFWITVVLNLGAVAFLLSPWGAVLWAAIPELFRR